MSVSPIYSLVSLFISMFDAEGLWRFARHAFGERYGLQLDPDASISLQAEKLAAFLTEEGLVDDRLFEQLLAERPDESEIIGGVRRELLGPSGTSDEGDGEGESPGDAEDDPTPEPEPESGGVPEERLEWRQRLRQRLESTPLETPEPPRAWIEAAAVLPSFSLLELNPVEGEGEEIRPVLAERLTAVSDVLPDGRLSLHLRRRRETLARLIDEDRIDQALQANAAEVEASVHSRLLRRIVEERYVDPRDLGSFEELTAAYDVAMWLTKSRVLTPDDRDRLARALERQRLIEPLRRLRGTHFRGRETEEADLWHHLRSDAPPVPLSLWGVGGAGKSALLGKVILRMEAEGYPWVYLDFDHPRVEPTKPRRMVELIARQLALFYDAELGSALVSVESAAAGDDYGFTLQIDQGAPVEDVLRAIGDRLVDFTGSAGFALVFDTFEQVQVRGPRVVEAVRGLIDAVAQHLPEVRVVVSGRARAEWDGALELKLGDLEESEADEVLIALGVDDAGLRQLIIDRCGTSPLSLRLAADAVVARKLSADDMESLVLHLSEVQRQGELYTRILGHIPDREVRRLAHPGLVVRRVTEGVIREVLADVCGIDPDQAAQILERLPNHVSLFEPGEAMDFEGPALRHHNDVRERMLRLMVDDSVWADRMKEVHLNAIRFYEGRTDAIARAEEIYHHLALDHPPESFEHRWSPDLAASLSRNWFDPLPSRARAWLAPRLGYDIEDRDDLRDVDWELHAIREAEARLESGDARGALDVLRERPSRRPGSQLHMLEVRALQALGQHDDALSTVDRALDEAVQGGRVNEMFRLQLAGAEVAQEGERPEQFERYLERAIETANRVGDAHGRVKALELGMRAARQQGTVDDPYRAALEEAFIAIDDAQLRSDPDLSRRLLIEVGEESTPIVRKAAQAFGNRSDQTLIRRNSFVLADLLETLEGSEAGRAQLSELAGSVGLSKEDYEIKDLAQQMVRYDRLGDAIVAVLDHSGADRGLRIDAVRMFTGDE